MWCRLVEVKCHYGSDCTKIQWRNMTPIKCAKDTNFFCHEINWKLHLKETQLHVPGSGSIRSYEPNRVDFVIWTKKGISVERINFNEASLSSMLQKLREFYIGSMIPEIFARRVECGNSLC